MHRVGARLDLKVHDATERAAELGRIRARLQLELVERVDAREEHDGLQPRLVVVDAVEHVVVVARPLAVRRERRRRAPGEAAGAVDVRAGNAAHDAGNGSREADEVAAVERQRLDLLFRHRGSELGRGSLNERGGAGDGHHLAHGANLELDVDPDMLVDAKIHVRERHFLEPGQLGDDRVSAGRQRWRCVLSVGIGCQGARDPGAGVRQRDGGAGHHGSGAVGDQAEDRAGHRLRGQCNRNKARRDEYDETSLHVRPPRAVITAPATETCVSCAAPRWIEISWAVATMARAMSLPTSPRGMRSAGPATLTAATTSP